MPMPDPLPESELSAIAARADAATPEPWIFEEFFRSERRYRLGLMTQGGRGILFHQAQWEPTKADRAFLAAARSDVPALVAEVRRLRAAVEALTPLARLGLNARQWAAENMQNVEEVLEIAHQAVDRLAEINSSKQDTA